MNEIGYVKIESPDLILIIDKYLAARVEKARKYWNAALEKEKLRLSERSWLQKMFSRNPRPDINVAVGSTLGRRLYEPFDAYDEYQIGYEGYHNTTMQAVTLLKAAALKSESVYVNVGIFSAITELMN